ncbi:MAG: NAD(+) synthase [Actinobacteria bacterium]|nr:NAD(+) synthase [Actinomycetota bacterium]
MGSQLRVALAQVNPTVGALKLNSDLIVERSLAAYASQAHLVVFPEMVVTGYPVEDLALRASFRSASKSMVADIARRIADGGAGELTVFLGYLDEVAGSTNRLGQPHGAPQNALAVIHQGEIKASYAKHHLPNYGVFDEFRNFVPGDSSLVVRIHGIDVGVAICEDIWQEGGTVAALVNRKPGLVIVPNGSPYERNKDDLRLALVQKRAKQIGAPLAYVNMTGGQDDLVIAPRLDDETEIWQALVVGLRDYVLKNGFAKVALGVSGGIDSALVAAIATDALGAKNVLGIALPSKYSSDHSLSDAQALAKNLGIEFRTVRIEEMVESFIVNLTLNGLAEENVQARVRGTTLMGISNQEGHLILATGNKSELAVGYSTLYGDAVGGFAPIKDIYKTDVWALARWRNTQGSVVIPVNSIDKEPSAELRPGQKDSDSLPEYSLLDQILLRYVDGDASSADLVAAGFDAGLVARVISLVDKAEYKRRQYPPGTKVSSRAFGKDRRLPITSSWRE